MKTADCRRKEGKCETETKNCVSFVKRFGKVAVKWKGYQQSL